MFMTIYSDKQYQSEWETYCLVHDVSFDNEMGNKALSPQIRKLHQGDQERSLVDKELLEMGTVLRDVIFFFAFI